MIAKGSDRFDRLLIEVAQKCADEVDLRSLAQTVSEALLDLPDVCVAGISVFDEERHAVQRYSACREPVAEKFAKNPISTIREDETAAEATEIPSLLRDAVVYRVRPPEDQLPSSLRGWLEASGAVSYCSAPVRLQGALLGAIFAGSPKSEASQQDLTTATALLARTVTPILYNCLTHARFKRGDRRRDALVALSNVINSSLELDTVLTNARRVISGLEGHCMSAICLLNDGNQTFRCYQNGPSSGDMKLSVPDATIHRVVGSVVARLLENGHSYESDDLEHDCCYDEEHEFKKAGVRRYLALPLLARGRILGGFAFGTQDRRPRRKVEYWLYENIALQLALAIDNAAKHEQLQRFTDRLANQNAYLKKEIQTEQGFGEMIGASRGLQVVREAILNVAPTDTIVLITGETGTGKELVARSLHDHSARAGHPFIKVNSPGIPEGMVESELFGHERGAFTSAVERRIGRFELARDGTIFLDEIGELSLAVQAKLLRVLQDGEFERVGGSKTLSTNARIIVATNRDLSQAIDAGRFRADLYYRLHVFPIQVPPLRDRQEDIPLLAEVFMREFNQRLGKRLERIDEECMEDLRQRAWPGNIRELRHVIERAAILSSGSCLYVEPNDNDEALMEPTSSSQSGLATLNSVQADHIRRALEACSGVIEGTKGAAALLGVKPSTLRFRIKRLGIERP